VTLLEFPFFTCTLKNVDVAGETFALDCSESWSSERSRVQAIDPDGNPVPVRSDRGGSGSEGFERRVLGPGEAVELPLRLSDYAQFTLPGEFRVRVLYHEEDDIADEKTVAGRVVSTSPPFTLHLRAREEKATRAEVEEVRRWVREIDTSKPIPLMSAHWNRGLRFEGEVAGPEDRLFRKGWVAVP